MSSKYAAMSLILHEDAGPTGMPEGQTQAMHRQRLVLVLLALVLYRHVEVSLSRVVAWVLYRQRLVLELLAPAPTSH